MKLTIAESNAVNLAVVRLRLVKAANDAAPIVFIEPDDTEPSSS
jgi:hypothetical protein